MTRITQHAAEIARQAAVAAHKKSAKPRRSKPAGQFATLYRGTRFAHGGPPGQPSAAQAQRTRKMAARLARRRRPARGKRGAVGSDGAEGADAAGEPAEFEVQGDEPERHGGHGGGRGGQGDEQDDAPPRAATFNRGRRQPAAAPIARPPAPLLPAPDRDLDPHALRDTCARELLALQSELAAQPGAGVAARVHAWSARWLGMQRDGVALPEADIETLRAHPAPRRDAAGGAPPLPDAARDFNLLAGLLLRQFDRPRTARQCECALDTLRALRRTP